MKNLISILWLIPAISMAQDNLLTSPVGVSGGQVEDANVLAHVSAGDESKGGRIASQDGRVVELGSYTGQLSDVVGFEISLSPPAVSEEGSAQLEARMVLDDDTVSLFDPSLVNWSVLSGPLAGISNGGLITANTVAANQQALVQGDYLSFTDQLTLVVEDSDPDNYSTYAGDGIDDAWQIDFFGIDHPDAGPDADPDNDGQNNFFEFLALVDPTDQLSFFWKEVKPSAADPDQTEIGYGPVSNERIYSVEFSEDLTGGSYAPVPGMTSSDAGLIRTSLDPNPQAMSRFYRVKISKP